jgi:hypothetical protein
MNAAFARGLLLYLSPDARVSSTFAGHYDLAAYLVFLIPLALAFYGYKKNILAAIPFALAIFVLTLTASRSSFGAYVVAIIAFVIYTRRKRLIIMAIAATILSSLFSTNLVQRYFKTFQVKQIFVNENTGQVVVPQKVTSNELPAGTFYIPKDERKNQTATAGDTKLMREELLKGIRKEASASGVACASTSKPAHGSCFVFLLHSIATDPLQQSALLDEHCVDDVFRLQFLVYISQTDSQSY